MRNALTGLALVMVFCFGVSQPVNATGFGFYGSTGSGSGDWSFDNNLDVDVDTAHTGAGFVLDTAVAQDKLFNYQLNLGYDKFKIDSSGTELVDLSGLMISNAFGFGIVRAPGFRMWIGPEIRVAWPSGSSSGLDYDLFGLGFGPALGFNFNLPGSMTIALKAGYQTINYAGKADGPATWYDVDIEEKMAYLNIGFMFRSFGDMF